MSDFQKSASEQLQEVNEAISKILSGGQSYKIGSRSLTRASLTELFARQKELQAEVNSEGNSDLLDNTYVAYFDGR